MSGVITQVIHWLLLIIGAGVGLVIASVFVGLALMIMRTLWRVAGTNFDAATEEERSRKLRRDR